MHEYLQYNILDLPGPLWINKDRNQHIHMQAWAWVTREAVVEFYIFTGEKCMWMLFYSFFISFSFIPQCKPQVHVSETRFCQQPSYIFNIKGTWILLLFICAALLIPLKDWRLTWINTRTSSKSKTRSDRFVLAEMGRFLLSSSSLLSGTQSMSCRENHRSQNGGPRAWGNIRIWERTHNSSQQLLQSLTESWHKLTGTGELDTGLSF